MKWISRINIKGKESAKKATDDGHGWKSRRVSYTLAKVGRGRVGTRYRNKAGGFFSTS